MGVLIGLSVGRALIWVLAVGLFSIPKAISKIKEDGLKPTLVTGFRLGGGLFVVIFVVDFILRLLGFL